MSNYKLPMDYIDVATRIVEFRTQHPEGSLQQASLDFKEVAGGWWVVYTAAAYRTPDDARPGMGTAWEPVPGKTNFTRDSEVQNAETAAWGRAIVAALAADTKKGIASAEEVRNRQAPEEAKKTPRRVEPVEPFPINWDALMDLATTREQLEKVGADLAVSDATEGERDRLRALYTKRLEAL